MNIPPEDQDIEVIKSFEGVLERVNIKILQPTFRSQQDVLKCMNSSFEGVKIKFSQRKKHLSLVNENNKDIKIIPTQLISQIWGCEDNEKNSSILLKPGKTHTFPQKNDLYAGIPKVLSIRISLESNQGYVNTMNDQYCISNQLQKSTCYRA